MRGGADPSTKDNIGETALSKAQLHKRDRVVALLTSPSAHTAPDLRVKAPAGGRPHAGRLCCSRPAVVVGDCLVNSF